ncbi:MAG: glycogen synthase GlgA [Methylococcales bacterium]|nr:glycogen synthase GlgA [Methylococcales bacterium]
MKKILFVSSEAHPLIKTGGLADVSGSLPKALHQLSQSIHLLLPKYQGLNITEPLHHRCMIRIDNREIHILETRLPDVPVPVWLVDYPPFFNLSGNPYSDAEGQPWENNLERFTLFCKVATEIAMDRTHLHWKPDVVHCNDWQSGLVPALLSLEKDRPVTVFTIHNLAYQGLYPAEKFPTLNLPKQLWNPESLEFFGMLSMIKGGLVHADHITTVSPSYALEIQTSEYGYGLEGLLHHKQAILTGIINGIDTDIWNPKTDDYLIQNYDFNSLKEKNINKTALQAQLSLPVDKDVPVFGLISRLVEQKGIDLVLECLPEMLMLPIQFILLGSGHSDFEQRLHNLALLHPHKLSVTIGYDESLAHLIEAGVDIFLMPSRFEPCGLNQLYSQRYGTIPIVRKTGGLIDTIEDALPETLANHTATGIAFHDAQSDSLMEAIKRAMILFYDKTTWKKLQGNCMRKDFSWKKSATEYLALYTKLLN